MPDIVKVRLGAQGRLVVPARMRRSLGFRSGQDVVVRVEGQALVVETPTVIERRLLKRMEGVKDRSLADELIAERRQEARRERLD